MASELILQLQNTDGTFTCEKYDNLPAPKSAYIAICYTDNLKSENLARGLKDELVDKISKLGSRFSQSSPPCGGLATNFMGCQALAVKENTKLLIAVSDGQISTFADNSVLHWREMILTVLESGINPQFLPPPFNIPQAVFWKFSTDEVIPVIFGKLGISDEDLRIFISYRQKDTSELAEQLFDALNHRGFEVFLDRFSIRPGINFQDRLYQELSDKAMLLFLESENFLDSEWIQLEINFAKKYRLGYLALNIDNAEKSLLIDSQYREEISRSHFEPDNTLKEAKLQELLLKIETSHATALYLKRNYLNENIEAAILNSKKKQADFDSYGFINHGAQPYKIWTTARPPKLADYQYLDDSCSSARKIIFGPEFMEDQRKNVNDWLRKKLSVEFFNEGQIDDLIKSV